ncbi:MAG TPA: hypothetical protein PKD09_21075 [Aggregatilinea sp.]|jgi:nitrogen regulatory protein PII|uniref:P-II family nitrogen regulator n=1 Tax=Aggregatilinea sp. TaxID=2806333 RepID=UPI002BC8B019|nr:hypothetical protein [Aggregatilinea sp.]HML24160.1 hypothetical protein [Aggregatilinea sp.]
MAKLVILITPQMEKGLEVAEAWEAAGAAGVTLIESYGLHHVREKSRTKELPLFVSMVNVLRQVEETNQTILSVVPDELVDSLLDAACSVLGDLRTQPDTGVAFVLDVDRIFGSDTLKPLT